MPAVISPFRTPAGQAAYEAAYQRTLALWPEEHESFFVTTSFGETHVLGLGDPHAPPMVLVHGFGFSAAQWYPNAPALAKHFRIYAPDVPDQLGRSQLTQPIFTAQNYAVWMRELVDNLASTPIHVVGISHGGWLAVNFARVFPICVKRLTAISPSATFAPLSLRLVWNGLLALVTRREPSIYRSLEGMTTLKGIRGMPIMAQFVTGLQNMALRPVGLPKVYSRDELRSLTMPVQLILGECDRVYARPSRQVLEAARERLPQIEPVLIAGGGHAVTLDQPQAVNAALLAFHLHG